VGRPPHSYEGFVVKGDNWRCLAFWVSGWRTGIGEIPVPITVRGHCRPRLYRGDDDSSSNIIVR